jgi:hypothetical protein
MNEDYLIASNIFIVVLMKDIYHHLLTNFEIKNKVLD